MPTAVLSQKDLVARGISLNEQYRLRGEGKLPTNFENGSYQYPAAAVAKLSSADEEVEDEDEDEDDDKKRRPPKDNYPYARADFDAAVAVLTRRGVPRQRALRAVSIRQPKLYAAYLESLGSKPPTTQFTAAQRQQLVKGWRAAVAAEVAAGASLPTARLRAGRKHPGLHQAVSGQ